MKRHKIVTYFIKIIPLYYPSTGAAVPALHSRNIRARIYFLVFYSSKLGNRHQGRTSVILVKPREKSTSISCITHFLYTVEVIFL